MTTVLDPRIKLWVDNTFKTSRRPHARKYGSATGLITTTRVVVPVRCEGGGDNGRPVIYS